MQRLERKAHVLATCDLGIYVGNKEEFEKPQIVARICNVATFTYLFSIKFLSIRWKQFYVDMSHRNIRVTYADSHDLTS